MKAEDYDALYTLLEEIRQETSEIETQIDDNTRSIREADAYLMAYTDSQPDDVKVFSPRKMEILYKEEIQNKKVEKSVYEGRNENLCRRRDILKGRVSSLQDILGHQKKDSSSWAETARKEYKSSIKELDSLADKIGQSSAWIEKNPFQAKQDFAIIAKRLRETVDRMRDIFG